MVPRGGSDAVETPSHSVYKSGEVYGVVTDTRGNLLGAATVVLVERVEGGRPGRRRRGHTVTDGSFRLTGVPAAARWNLRVLGHRLVRRIDMETQPGLCESLSVEVWHESDLEAIRGRIVDRNGRGVPGVFICCRPRNPRTNQGVWSGSDGRFSVWRTPDDPREPVRIHAFRQGVTQRPYLTERVSWGGESIEIVVELGQD